MKICKHTLLTQHFISFVSFLFFIIIFFFCRVPTELLRPARKKETTAVNGGGGGSGSGGGGSGSGSGSGGGATDAAGRSSPMVVTQTMERVVNTDISSERKRRRQVNSSSTNVRERENF